MSGIEPDPLFVDTGPFYARFDADDASHDPAMALFERIRTGDLLYRPVYTSRYVLAETTRLLLHRVGHEAANTALDSIRQGELFTVLEASEAQFDDACEQFEQYDDQTITLVDHLSTVLSHGEGVDRVFTFDPDDFRTFGFTAIPGDTDGG